MVRNEILDEIYAARETLLEQHAGSLHDYVAAATERARSSRDAKDTSIGPYGHRGGAGSIDFVVKDFPLDHEFSVEEVEAEVQRRGLQKREAVREHLYKLEKDGHVVRSNGSWKRLD